MLATAGQAMGCVADRAHIQIRSRGIAAGIATGKARAESAKLVLLWQCANGRSALNGPDTSVVQGIPAAGLADSHIAERTIAVHLEPQLCRVSCRNVRIHKFVLTKILV